MNKKILKYTKFVLAIILIMSFLVPSFASSTNDISGDAFITKNELDTTFQDIREKITKLQANIDAKIDIQVTTYLDRNGIWSAKPQVVPTGHIDWTMRSTSDLSSFYRFTSLNGSARTHNYNLGGFVLTKCNKSGLMVLTFEDYVDDLDVRSGSIGYCNNHHQTGNYNSDLMLNTFVNLLQLKGNWSESDIGKKFYRKQTDAKTVFQEDLTSATKRSIEDNTEKVIASQKVWIQTALSLEYSTALGTRRCYIDTYVSGTRYTMMGFVKKDMYYVLSWQQILALWTPYADQIDCLIDPNVHGARAAAIKDTSVKYRPQCNIILCNVY